MENSKQLSKIQYNLKAIVKKSNSLFFQQYVANVDESSGHVEYTLQVDDYFDWEDAYEDNSDDEFSEKDEQAVLMHRTCEISMDL